jgi:hypothetical protein
MFGVDKPVVSIELSSDSSVCLACEKPGGNCFEVLNLELPSKLYQVENQHDSINTCRDLKIRCGTLTENRLIDVNTNFKYLSIPPLICMKEKKIMVNYFS